ncbi:hypothetical protein AAHA92_15494 [Salvia divinorum]
MKFKPPSKRIKTDSSISSSSSLPSTQSRDAELNTMRKSMVHEAQNANNVSLRIQQARDHAVAQAQQDGCTGNFRVFNSPFGNYLVPVIPTRAELGG